MKRPIRILELRQSDGSGGGPEKTILLGAARADRRRFHVSLAYIRRADDDAFDIDRRARGLGVSFHALTQRWMGDYSIYFQARELVRSLRIDIVHGHDYKSDALALLLSRRCGCLPLSTAHGFTGHRLRERLLLYPADKWLLRQFPAVVAVSDELCETLIAAGVKRERIHKLLNGIDHRRYFRRANEVEQCRQALGLRPGEIAIGGVGRLERQKRIDLLLHAFAELIVRHPHLRLLIVGEGSERQACERLAVRLGLQQTCRFLGYRADMEHVYHALDLLIQSSDYEGTPNVVLEAMAHEVPVVATNVGGTHELIENGVHGLLVPPRDVQQLVAATREILHHPNQARRRAVAARQRVEGELSFDARQDALEQIYEDLMARRQASHSAGELPAEALQNLSSVDLPTGDADEIEVTL